MLHTVPFCLDFFHPTSSLQIPTSHNNHSLSSSSPSANFFRFTFFFFLSLTYHSSVFFPPFLLSESIEETPLKLLIRLVRCPKCDKLLPESSDSEVYQCGACCTVLRSEISTSDGELSDGFEKLVNSEEGIGGGSMRGSFDLEGSFDMANRSPLRSNFRDGNGSVSPIMESHLTELDGDSPKSSMTAGFLSNRPTFPDSFSRPRTSDGLPMSERGLNSFGSDGVSKPPVSFRNASRSPFREIGGRPAVSVRTRHFSQSPMRDLDGMNMIGKPPVGPRNGDVPSSSMRGDLVSKYDENVNYPGARRRSWRDHQLGDEIDQISDGRESMCGSEQGMTSEGSGDDPPPLNKEITPRDLRFRNDNFGPYASAGGSIDQWVPRRGGVGVEHDRFAASSSISDGPSNYRSDPPAYGYGDPRNNFASLRGPASSIHELELERAQLLQKYKELKDQLSSLDINRVPTHGLYSIPDDYSEDGSGRFAPVKSVRRRPQYNPVPIHEMGDLYSYHSPLYEYDDPFHGQIERWPQNTHRYPVPKGRRRSLDFDQDSLRSYDNVLPHHTPGRSLDFDHESMNSYLDEPNSHHRPACSCSLCGVRDWQKGEDLPGSLADGISNRRASSMTPKRHVPWVYNPRMAQTNPRERPPQHPRRTRVTTQNKRLCHPVAGGSPFLLCRKCSQLLKLPKLMQNSQVECGACSAVMSFDFENKSFDLVPSQLKLNSVGSNIGKVLKGLIIPRHRRGMTATSTNAGSYDFDAAGLDSEPSEIISKGQGQRLSSSSADNMQCLSPSSSYNSRSSKEDSVSDNASVQNGSSSLSTAVEKPSLVRPPKGSPLEEHFQYSNCFRKLEADGKVNGSGGEIKVLKMDTPGSVDVSSDNTAFAREAEVHSHETSSTEDTGEVEADKGGNTMLKDKHSPIAALMKWGFASKPGRPSPGGGVEVYVNGRPIPHREVKRAEKFAGPIQPGEYWYDSKAGFWGVMGHRCFGIIPPSIQEFNSPMPENCSNGDSAVYVNGRELHKKDLDLLASRGLPTTSNKRYIIDISGKVVHEGTREFIVNLGRLAPTVERSKCGYGMQVPEQLD